MLQYFLEYIASVSFISLLVVTIFQNGEILSPQYSALLTFTLHVMPH